MQRYQALFFIALLAVLLSVVAFMRTKSCQFSSSFSVEATRESAKTTQIEASTTTTASAPTLPAHAEEKGPEFSFTYESKNIEKLRHISLNKLSALDLEILYFSLAEQQHIVCPRSVRIGDTQDGGWDVCIGGPFDIGQSRPCVAFSFGINNVWSYDDALADKYGCRVHMFDPSMRSVPDHQRRPTSWFYRLGLSGKNLATLDGWPMRTLCTLFHELGYGQGVIDIVKVDIDHWEWESFSQAISEGCLARVKQLLFESHTNEMLGAQSDYHQFIVIWQRLFDLGFRTWNWHRNPHSVFFDGRSGLERACCYEHYLININFLYPSL